MEVAKPSVLVAPRPEKSIDGSKVHDGTSTTNNFAVAGPTYDTAAVAPSATAVRRAEVGNLTKKSCSLSHLPVNIFGLLGKKKNMVRRRMQSLLVSHLHIYLRKNVDSHTSLQVLLCQMLAFFGNCTLPLIECYTCRDFFGNCTLPFDQCHTCSDFFGDCTLPIIKCHTRRAFFGKCSVSLTKLHLVYISQLVTRRRVHPRLLLTFPTLPIGHRTSCPTLTLS